MRYQSSHLLALLLSVTAHIGLFLIVGNGKGLAPGDASSEQSARMVVAFLHAQGAAEKAGSLPSAAPTPGDSPPADSLQVLSDPGDAASQTPDVLTASHVEARHRGEEPALLANVTQAEPYYYYLARELTEIPVVVRDISPLMVVVLPDMSRRPLRVHLLINEQGDVDQVEIEEPTLSTQAKRFIREAFATAKFRPGRIGEVSVKSELSIEVTLDQVLMAPVAAHQLR